MKYKRKKKYELGVQSVEVPAVETPAESAANIGKATATGAAVGSTFGPVGTIVGGAAGLVRGSVMTGVRRSEQKRENRQASAFNQYLQKNANVATDPNLQFYQAKNGKDFTDDKEGKAEVVSNGQTHTVTYKSMKRKPQTPDSTGVPRYSHEAPHYNPTVYGHNFGQMPKRQKYAHGVKRIEAEEDELVMAKQGKSFTLKADLKGQPSHEEGGVDINVKEGDVIFPGKKREEILSAYKKGDYKKIDKERRKLPKDTVKAENGLDEVGLDRSVGLEQNIPTETPTITPKTRNYSGLYGVAQAAPTIYNSFKSFDKPVKTTRRFYNPEKYKYTDTTAPLLSQSNQIYETQKRNAVNIGGNRGQQLNALNQIASDRFSRDSNIIGQGVGQKAQIANMNTDLINNARMSNLNLANQYDDLDLRNRAKRTEHAGRAAEGASTLAYRRQQENNLRERDKILMNTLATNDYDISPEGRITYRRKARKGLDMNKKGKC